jgi:peroxiredoxin
LITLVGCTSEPPAPSPQAVTSSEPAETVEATKPPSTTDVPSDATPPVVPSQPSAETTVQQPSIEPTRQPNNVPTATAAAEQPQPVEKQQVAVARDEPNRRQSRTVFYRADASQPAAIPVVQLSKGHEALCRVKVGDTMPTFELEQLGGGRRRTSELAGKKATVVVFWKAGRRMTDQLLVDLGPDVIEPFGGAGVAVVGVAVGESASSAQAALERTGANFPNFLDTVSRAFAQVGSDKLPRAYLLDPQGKILWFDIEYSQTTRRELHQALRAVTADQPE